MQSAGDAAPTGATPISGSASGATAASFTAASRGTDRRRRPTRVVRRVALVVIAFAVVLVVAAVLWPTYRVPSASMAPVLPVGDRIVASRVAYWGSGPARGDVVVFRAPRGWDPGAPDAGRDGGVLAWLGQTTGLGPDDSAVVKRVVAVGGDTVRCCDSRGRVVVTTADGGAHHPPESAEADSTPQQPFGPVRVPSDRLWLMGDNRVVSVDSRAHVTDAAHGTVSVGDVVGRVVLRLWPPTTIGR